MKKQTAILPISIFLLGISGLPAVQAQDTWEKSNLVKDGSFEGVGTSYIASDAAKGRGNGYVIWGFNDPVSGNLDTEGFWQFSSSANCGFYAVANSSSAFTNSGAGVDDGNYVLGIQVYQQEGTASVSQNITGLTPGAWYYVAYNYNNRLSWANNQPSMTTTFGNSALQTDVRVAQTANAYQTHAQLVQAESESQKFSVTNRGVLYDKNTDWNLLLDNVRIYKVPGKTTNLVKDGSFEGVGTEYAPSSFMPDVGYVINGSADPASGNLDSSGFWKYQSSGTTGYYLRSNADNMLTKGTTLPDGDYVAGLQTYVTAGTTSISQDITGLEAGKYYALAYRANARPNDTAHFTATLTNSSETQTLQSNLPVPHAAQFKAFASTFKANGTTAKLTFSNTSTAADLDNTLTIDDVQMVGLPTQPIESGYTPIYALDMTAAPSGGFHNSVPYAYDAAQAWKDSGSLFDKIGYYAELVDKQGNTQTIFLTMDAFTNDVSKIGVPGASSQIIYDRVPVTNLEVQSNVEGVSRTLPEGGTLEFWPGNYAAGANGIYDSNDNLTTGRGFGSMQFHDSTTNTTLFSFSGWGANPGAEATAGIGNSTPADFPANESASNKQNTDWTFTDKIARGEYLTANLYAFVHETSAILKPDAVRLFQRNENGTANALFTGDWLTDSETSIDTIRVSENGSEWTNLENLQINADKTFSGTLTLAAGWHDFEMQALDAEGNVLTSGRARIGVGDIFITAGQSNSANHGQGLQTPSSENVYSLDLATGEWKIAADPQPNATGTGGSTWPAMGDALSEMLGGDVPIGFVNIGVGGSSIAAWDPDNAGSYFSGRLETALEMLGDDAKAILWHQGETDSQGNNSSMTGEQYAEALSDLIEASREVSSNGNLDWVVAFVSYFNGMTDEELRAAQQAVIDGDSNVFSGPDSDELLDGFRAADGVHFNAQGLQTLGQLWAQAVYPALYETQRSDVPEPSSVCLMAIGLAVLGMAVRRKKARA